MEHIFNIPKIMSEDESSPGSEYGENDADHQFTRLTSMIRSQYFSYLRKVIDQNYQEWTKSQSSYKEKNIPAEYLDKCATQLEERAVKCSMVVQLYRKYMLRIITGIRRDTTCGKLISKLKTAEMKSDIRDELISHDVCNARQFRNKRESAYNPYYKLEHYETSSESERFNHGRNSDQDSFEGSFTPPMIEPGIKLARHRKTFQNDRKSVKIRSQPFCKNEQNLRIHKNCNTESPLRKMPNNAYQERNSLQYNYPLEVDLHLKDIANGNLLQNQERYQISCDGAALREMFAIKTSEDNEIINYRNPDNPNLINYEFPKIDSSLNEKLQEQNTADELCDDVQQPPQDASSPISSTNMTQSEQNLEEQQPTCNDSSLTEMRYEFLSLQEKIQHFQEKLDERESLEDEKKQVCQKRKRSPPSAAIRDVHRKLFLSPAVTQPISPVSTSSEEELNEPMQDSIAKDLESLFAEATNGETDDIFGDGSYNPELDYILREIEKSELPGCNYNNSTTAKETETKAKIKDYKLQPVICDLNDSLWPCEFHMWKQTLREILSQISEVDIRHHERIRQRFLQLFGEDSEDEFAPYSPTLELDSVLISSCMKRIAPIIVKYLMRPLREGLIANRYLFKKLAKKLAYNIVLDNQYADDDYIKERIDVFFVFRRDVKCLEDIDIT